MLIYEGLNIKIGTGLGLLINVEGVMDGIAPLILCEAVLNILKGLNKFLAVAVVERDMCCELFKLSGDKVWGR
jgi:hypothetical protein